MKLLFKILAGLMLIILGILSLALIPSPQPDAPKPWEIKRQQDGNIEVLGLHLGNDTYADAQQAWQELGETAIFTEAGKATTAEVFFDRINLGGFSSKVIINLEVEPALLEEMIDRASGGILQQSGARRYQPTYDDRQFLLNAPVMAITYMPTIRPDKAMLVGRFGEPEEIKQDTQDELLKIWVYPQIGLTIRLHPKDKPVLIYQARRSASR